VISKRVTRRSNQINCDDESSEGLSDNNNSTTNTRRRSTRSTKNVNQQQQDVEIVKPIDNELTEDQNDQKDDQEKEEKNCNNIKTEDLIDVVNIPDVENEKDEEEEEKEEIFNSKDTKSGVHVKETKTEQQQQQQIGAEKEEYLKELECWSCICLLLEDWNSILEKYKQSKKKEDLEISKTIEDNYITEMPSLFQKAEKDRIQRLLAMAPKRQSERLQVKQQHTISSNGYNSTTDDNGTTNGYYSDNLNSSPSKMGLNSGSEMNFERTDEERRLEREKREARQLNRMMRREQQVLTNGAFSENENSQTGSTSSDFNSRNYFLMNKGNKKKFKIF
jgi:hypothetical protein